MNYLDLFDLEEKIQIMDVGAAAISEIPVYKKLMDIGIGKLNAFEGDQRHSTKLKEEYEKSSIEFFNYYLFKKRVMTYSEDGMLMVVYSIIKLLM